MVRDFGRKREFVGRPAKPRLAKNSQRLWQAYSSGQQVSYINLAKCLRRKLRV